MTPATLLLFLVSLPAYSAKPKIEHPGCNAWYSVDKNHMTAEEKLAGADAINAYPCGCKVQGMQLAVKDAKECHRLKKECEKDGCQFWGSK